MSAINDFQFELLPAVDATDGVVFGIHSDVSMNEDGFHPGSTDWANQDGSNPATGSVDFGRDALLGPVWAWDLHVNRASTANALETLGQITTAWRALKIRRTPRAILPLRYQFEGRVRRIYGRPGKFEASPDNLILSGYTPITCDFQAVDAFTYDDLEDTAVLAIGDSDSGATGGGFTFPLTFPYGLAPATEQALQIVVGGDAPTHPVVRFNGPVTNPRLETDEWSLALNYDIPAGQYIEVDTRPWAMTVMLNGTTSIPGVVGRRIKLYEATFEPGALEARFSGTSSSGTATCSIRWASAWNSF